MKTLIGPIEYEVKDNRLTLSFPLDGDGEPSKSGKTTVYASTHGNVAVPDTNGGILGLNYYRKR